MILLNEVAVEIRDWFDMFYGKTSVGMLIRSVWVGRPFDEYYELGAITLDEVAGELGVELGYGKSITFSPVSYYLTDDKNSLMISVDHGIFTYADMRRFGPGTVEFRAAH